VQRDIDLITREAGIRTRGDLGVAPIYIIGGIIFFVGLTVILAFNTMDIGLMASGIGLILIGIRERPRLDIRWVKFTGPPGMVLIVIGLLIFNHIL
jgi:hypothetical protein